MANALSKYTDEYFPIKVIFTNELVTGESLSSTTVSAQDLTDDTDATSDIIVSAVIDTTNENVVDVEVQNGRIDHAYRISCEVETSQQNTYKKDIDLYIIKKPEDTIEKHINEQFLMRNIFTSIIPAGETSIASQTVTVYDESNGNDVTNDILVGSDTDFSAYVLVKIHNGEAGKLYRIVMQITTSPNSYVLQKHILLKVY